MYTKKVNQLGKLEIDREPSTMYIDVVEERLEERTYYNWLIQQGTPRGPKNTGRGVKVSTALLTLRDWDAMDGAKGKWGVREGQVKNKCEEKRDKSERKGMENERKYEESESVRWNEG